MKVVFATILLLSVSAAWAGLAAGSNGSGSPAAVQAIRIAVEMVSLPIVVTTKQGKRVTDLQPDNFLVFEDGVAQTISGFAATIEPISVALVLDTSGSTKGKLFYIQQEAIRFINLLRPQDEAAVMSFSGQVRLLTDFTTDKSRAEEAIKSTRTEPVTALYEAVAFALNKVLKPVPKRTALVLFTDGLDTVSRTVSMRDTLELANEKTAAIYGIHFNTDSDMQQLARSRRGGFRSSAEGHRYLEQLSKYTGGIVYDAFKMEDLGPAFDTIAKELASQYSIGYYSTNMRHDGKFRKIQVKVKKSDLIVRTKEGYYALKDYLK